MINIIIPVYNVDKYLSKCLDSLFQQTYQEFMILIVDDGSTDNSLKIIEEYIAKYPEKITLIKQENQGVSVARNRALDIANKEFILFIDPDDYLEQTYIEKMINKAQITNSDIVMCDYQLVFENDLTHKKDRHKYMINHNEIYSGREIAHKMLNLEIEGYLWNKLFRRKQLLKNNFKFDEGRYIQDWHPVFKHVLKSDSISFINEPLYNYLQRSSSTVYKKDKKKIDDYFYAVCKIIDTAKRNNCQVELINRFSLAAFLIIVSDIKKMNPRYNGNLKEYVNIQGYIKLLPKTFDVIFCSKIPCKQKIKFICWKFNLYKVF